jgi:glutathione S-transferase
LQTASHAQVFHTPNGFDRSHSQGHIPQTSGSPHTPQQHGSAQFGILTTTPAQHGSIARLHQDEDIFGTSAPDDGDQTSNGHLPTAIVVDPPNLEEWRQKLFNVDELIILSEDEYVQVPAIRRFGS